MSAAEANGSGWEEAAIGKDNIFKSRSRKSQNAHSAQPSVFNDRQNSKKENQK